MARRFNTLGDCRRFLADAINRLEAGELEPDGLKVRAYTTQILSKIIECSNLEERVAALEQKLERGDK